MPLQISESCSFGGGGKPSLKKAVLRIIHNSLVDDIWTDDSNLIKYTDFMRTDSKNSETLAAASTTEN